MTQKDRAEKRLREISAFVEGRIADPERHSEIKIKGVGSIFHSKKGDITYLSERKYLPHLSRTQASAVIVSEELDLPIPQVIVSNPKLAFAKVVSLFSTFPALPGGISPLSFKEAEVEIGSDVTIGPFVYIGKGAKIGNRVILYPGVFVGAGVVIDESSVIYPNVVLYPQTSIGKRVIVHAGTVLGADGFGYIFDGKSHQKIPQVGKVIIEDDVEIGAGSAIDRAALDETRIGFGTKIDNLVQIGHNCKIGPMNMICGQTGLAGGVQTGKFVTMAGQVGVADQTVIPEGVTIGAKSGVAKSSDLEPHQIYFGIPVKKGREFMFLMSYLSKLPELFKRMKKLEELDNK